MAQKFKPLPSLARLVELGFTYNPVTGVLYCNGVERVPNANSQISISGSLYTAHRICWLLATGVEPSEMVDHHNGLDNDNRFCNLRLATDAQNCANRRSKVAGRHPGVKYDSKDKVWIASLIYEKKYYHLGRFTEEADAIKIRRMAERIIIGDFAFSNRPTG